MTPKDLYQKALSRPGFEKDVAQARAVESLQRVYQELVAVIPVKNSRSKKPRKIGLIGRFSGYFLGALRQNDHQAISPVRGLYLWGGVGRGKTYLMDLFFDALPFENKMRSHFHRFMKRIHEDLKSLQGEKNPIDKIADQIAENTAVVCFDEFFVSDITDAMILGRLFEALFARGVSLVATSNIPPDELYKNGLQRARFLPAIQAIKEYSEVLELASSVDYRLRALERAEIYHYPLDQAAKQNMAKYFEELAIRGEKSVDAIEIEGRQIQVCKAMDDILWVNFDHLCGGPRSQRDYIEIARIYHAVLLDQVPQLRTGDDDRARRFIYLVDEFYDRGVKLIISAEVEIESLYTGTALKMEFQRTVSRLLEMQSLVYLGREHQPD